MRSIHTEDEPATPRSPAAAPPMAGRLAELDAVKVGIWTVPAEDPPRVMALLLLPVTAAPVMLPDAEPWIARAALPCPATPWTAEPLP